MTDRPTLAGTVTEAVRDELTRQGKTAATLANLMGVSHMYLSRRLNGHTSWDVADIEEIARLLGVPVERFLTPLLTPERAS